MSDGSQAPPQIAVFLPSLEVGGAERAMLNLAKGLHKPAMGQVELVLAEARGRYLADVPEGLALVDLRSPRVALSLFPLVRYLRRRRPAVLISAMEHANVVAIVARRLAGYPKCLIVSSHTLVSLAPQGETPARAILLPHLARLTYSSANMVVAISHAVAVDLGKALHLRAEKIRVIPNPIVADEMLRAELDPGRRLSSRRRNMVLFVGRLAREKDVPTLLRAFRIVKERREASLVLVGEGPLRRELQDLADDLRISSSIRWEGYVEDPYSLMREASVLVLPSRWEGLGAVVVEAMACGCSVVAADGPGGVREILEGGRYGTLVPVGDSTAMAGAISATLDSPFPEELLRGRAREYSIGVIADRYLDLIRDCLPRFAASPGIAS